MEGSGGLLGALFALIFVVIIVLIVLSPLLILGYGIVVGFQRRTRVQQYLAAEEPRLAHLLTSNVQQPEHPGGTALALGSVAYAADAPSRFVSSWRNLFGGKLESMSEQAEIARRLAVVRMLEHAAQLGATGVSNVRIETSEVFSGSGRSQRMVLELLAYGNALLPAPQR
ncbi:YbjQ family protein [Nocardioides limicola]|uniref:YbjQ family protein n=1 Tax=Nocardioides limicola TaxID=2803368 RepID=UPI00193B9F51|nr:heavy metal-binding domain-containing protein [Nocardioides sp. DJM-14]